MQATRSAVLGWGIGVANEGPKWSAVWSGTSGGEAKGLAGFELAVRGVSQLVRRELDQELGCVGVCFRI